MSSGELPGQASRGVALGPNGQRAAPLPAWVDLLREAARTAIGVPTAILLPDTPLAGETTALLCAHDRADGAEVSPATVLARLQRGDRVRVLPDEGIYEFDGAETAGFWLHALDVRNRNSAGRFLVPQKDVGRLEPTRRKRPLGKPNRHQWRPIRPTVWDTFAGSALGGNAALARLSVVLIGTRPDFSAALSTVGFSSAPGEPALSVADGLPWGRVDEDGDLELLYPAAASGEPLLAIARDHISARRLSERYPPGSLSFVSVRGEDAVADRTSAEALAARHSLLVLAPGRLREIFIPRRGDGWAVVELSGADIMESAPTGVRGLDRIASTSHWMRKAPSSLAQASPELEEAFRLLDSFNRAVAPHLEDDDDVNDAADTLRQAFFDASDWLSPPDKDELEDLEAADEVISAAGPVLRSVAGRHAADAARGAVAALRLFADTAAARAMTPKGDCVLRLAASAQNSSYRQVIVAGHGRTANRVMAFLGALGAPMRCVTPSELAAMEDVQRINVLSVLRREAFMRLVDPWAAPDMMFLGYQHEVDIYLQRLAGRRRLIDRLRPDARVLTRLPRLAAEAPLLPALPPEAPRDPVSEPEALAPPPRPLRRPPPLRTGELTKPARFCRFAGRSWMAMTDDHAVARLQTAHAQTAQVSTVDCRDLQVGDLILVREGGEKDIVREMAEQLAGREAYAVLRRQASYWRTALRASGHSPERLRKLLAEEGLDRGLPTLRYWMAEEGPIGPSDPDTSLPMIAAALGQNPVAKPWKDCREAIYAVRRHHVHAGFHLTRVLMQECGAAILEHSEHETAFELSLGTVWLLEVQELDAERRPWPYTQVNRVQWESESWRKRLLRRSSLDLNLDLNDLLSALDIEAADEDL